MATGKITLEETGSGGRYVYRDAEGEAELTFSRAGQVMIADHTGVPKQYKGQGIGLMLVERIVADARRDGMRIVPLCPFVAAMFRRHPAWADVLAEAARK